MGQVCLGGHGVSKGYLNRPDLNEKSFVTPTSLGGKRVYLTGDFGRILPDGTIEFLGRRDNQVSIRGFRIELGEIEQTANRLEGIDTAIVTTIEDQIGEEHIVMYFTSSESLSDRELRDYLLDELPLYMIPPFIVPIDKFEKTINGKVDRSKLPSPFGKQLLNANDKGVIFNKRNRISAFFSTVNHSPCIAQNASHCFDISVWQMFVSHLVGGKTVIYKNEQVQDVLAFINQIKTDQISILELVPSYLNLTRDIFEEQSISPNHWNGLDYLMVTGEALKRSLCNSWFSYFGNGIPLVNAYGPTEASDDITHHFIYKQEDEQKPVPIGTTIQNMKNYVLDEGLNSVPIGCKGLIHTEGIGVGQGYLNDPEKTNEVFINSPFHSEPVKMYNTGDVGRYLPNGELEYFGREDNQVKIRGNRIELGEIEHALTGVLKINEAIVIPRIEDGQEDKLVAFIQNKEELTQQNIRLKLAKILPGYMVPDLFIELDQFPLTDNGKVNRKALMKMEVSAKTDQAIGRSLEGLSDSEKIVYEAWELVLGQSNFSSQSNFFEIGGNSLKLMKLFRLLDDRAEKELRVTDLFKNVTIEEQAGLFGSEVAMDKPKELVELDF
jgi:acyl-coenzyme A synthetase/AMP-(fatty) acid ligase